LYDQGFALDTNGTLYIPGANPSIYIVYTFDAPVIIPTAGNTNVSLFFVDGAHVFPITQYLVSIQGGGETFFKTFPGTSTSPLLITDLTNDVAYTMSMEAFNIYGNSPFSNTVTVTPLVCFNEGTQILCINDEGDEEYMAVEDLEPGRTIVKSYQHGNRLVYSVGMGRYRNNPRWNEAMYILRKSDERPEQTEDLIVTGGHSLLVDELTDDHILEYAEKKIWETGEPLMIDDKYLLLAAVDKRFEKIENEEFYTFYHFALENDGNNDKRYGIWANGILSETISVNQMNRMFLRENRS
jgi:hypothetical protein